MTSASVARRIVAMEPPKAERRGSNGSVQSSGSAPMAASIHSLHSNSSISSSPPCSPNKSPRKTRLVRVRRNSLGMEVSRTVVDDDSSTASSIASSTASSKGSDRVKQVAAPASPKKTMNTTISTNAALLGVTASNATTKPNNLQRHSNTSRLKPPSSPTKVSITAVAPPPLSTSPRGIVLHKPQLTVNQKLLGIAKMDSDGTQSPATPVVAVPLPVSPQRAPKPVVTKPAVPSSPLSPTKPARGTPYLASKTNASTNAKAAVGTGAAATAAKGAGSNAATGTGSIAATKSVPTVSTAASNAKPHKSAVPKETPAVVVSPAVLLQQQQQQVQQGERLVRIMLNDGTASLTKETVDRTLQKHADLLRNQVQHKQQHKQELLALQGEQTQVVHTQAEQIATLQAELAKQKSLMAATLEIKDVEYQLLVKERDQKAVKVQQLTWRLAKERTAGKDKAAAAAAAMAATSSLTDRAEHAEHELSAQQQTIQALQHMVEHTVSALRGKDKFLRQLRDSQQTRRGTQGCHKCGCEPFEVLDEELAGLSSDMDESPIDLSSLLEAVGKGSAGRVRESMCSFPLEPLAFPASRSRASSGDLKDDDSSDATPLMGRSVGSGLSLDDDVVEPQKTERTACKDSLCSAPSAFPELEASLQLADLKFELESAQQQVIDAQEIIATHHQEQVQLRTEHDKVLTATKAKMAQLKNVLVACNERRLEAEQKLRALGQDVNTPHPKTSTVWNELGSSCNDSDSGTASPTGGSASHHVARKHDEVSELQQLRQSLAQTQDDLSKLQNDLDRKSAQLQEHMTKCRQLESQLAQAKKETKAAQKSIQSLELEHADQVSELVQARDCAIEAATLAVTSPVATAAGTSSPRATRRVDELTKRLAKMESSLQQSETLTRESQATVRTLQHELVEATRRADDAATSCQSATSKLSRVQAALDLSQAQVDSYGIMLKQQHQQQKALSTTTLAMMDHHSSCSSFEEFVENVHQVDPIVSTSLSPPLSEKEREAGAKMAAAQLKRLESELAMKKQLLKEAESSIESLQQQVQSAVSSPCTQSACRDAAAAASAEIATLKEELIIVHANLDDAQQKLAYLRNMVLSVATNSSETN